MKAVLIVVYFGSLPPWIGYFARSCSFNRDVEWLFFTDQTNAPEAPANLRFLALSPAAFRSRVSERLGIATNITSPRKLCDFRPTYGVLFDDYISGFDFWGHCDADVIFGDLRLLLSDRNLQRYDVISSRMDRHVSGHLSVYRNTELLRNAFRRYEGYNRILSSSEHFGFDEGERDNNNPGGITRILRAMDAAGEITPLWNENAASYPPEIARSRLRLLGKHPGILSPDDHWLWVSGNLYFKGDLSAPVAYLHFKNWKSEPGFSRMNPTPSERFVIGIDGIENCR